MELPNLLPARLRSGLSQRDLATRSGVSAVSISKLERGATKARPTTARKLAEALGVNIPALMGQPKLGTGGRLGSPVYALISGEPGDPDATWERVSPDEDEEGGKSR